MRGAAVLVVEVVGVFPDVEGQQGFEAAGDGVGGAGFLAYYEGAVFLRGEPYPAGAEEADAFGFEFGLEGLETPPLLIDLGCQRTRRGGLGGFGWCELGEVEVVVQDLAGVVEDGAGGSLGDNLFERHILELSADNEFVEVVDVCFQMLAVVESQCLRTDDRFQCVGA